jgi:hypothetical protein
VALRWPVVAEALARLGQREEFTAEDDLVFPGVAGTYLDASALYRRYKAALRRAGLGNGWATRTWTRR